MKHLRWLLVPVLLAAFAAPAFAVNPFKHPCVADAERACPGLRPGHHAVRQCLKEHPDAISPACREKWDEWLKEHERP